MQIWRLSATRWFKALGLDGFTKGGVLVRKQGLQPEPQGALTCVLGGGDVDEAGGQLAVSVLESKGTSRLEEQVASTMA